MKIALAQIKPKKGDIQYNILNHLHCVVQAHKHNCDFIVFPELSITGYEPSLAEELGIHSDDHRLNVLQETCDANHMAIAVGAPISLGVNRFIGMIVFQPNKDRLVYTKQILHADELPYFRPGSHQVYIQQNECVIAPAICYESLQIQHFISAQQNEFDIYLASVAKPANAITRAQKHFGNISKEYQTPILMVNSVGSCDNFIAAGNSAIWDTNGQMIGQLDATSESILVYDSNTSNSHEITLNHEN